MTAAFLRSPPAFLQADRVDDCLSPRIEAGESRTTSVVMNAAHGFRVAILEFPTSLLGPSMPPCSRRSGGAARSAATRRCTVRPNQLAKRAEPVTLVRPRSFEFSRGGSSRFEAGELRVVLPAAGGSSRRLVPSPAISHGRWLGRQTFDRSALRRVLRRRASNSRRYQESAQQAEGTRCFFGLFVARPKAFGRPAFGWQLI